MSAERVSPTWERAVEMSGDVSAVEGPLAGYHHETYVIPLPPAADGTPRIRGKCREPRSDLLWFDRRCFASEEELLHALHGRVTAIPDLIDVEGLRIQTFIEGETLGRRHRSGQAVPAGVVEQIVELFRQMADITPKTLTVERRCLPEDRPADRDTSGFLDRLICFAEERVYRDNLPAFQGLFESLGLDDDSFKSLRKHVAGLTERPFCLLHADLHRENFILDPEGRLWSIDWELAMFGDPLYDLATHLYLMRYPAFQERLMTERWRAVVEGVRKGSSRGWEEDLPKLLDFKRAQSVFTDVIRATQFIDSGPKFSWHSFARASSKVHKVLEAAAVPLGIETVPSRLQVLSSLVRWRRERQLSHG